MKKPHISTRKPREDLFLVYQVTSRFNGANIHRGRALVAAYQNAIERASDNRCQDLTGAADFVRKVETELRAFR